jgi:HEAT repeat protein
MNETLKQLSGGDLRSEGKATDVAAKVIQDPDLLADLLQGLRSEDKVVRGRTCATMEIISRDHAHLLEDTVPQLADLASADTVPQVRWHLAEIFANVPIPTDQAERIIPALITYLGDKSRIVKYCAVQALGVLGEKRPWREQIANQILALKDDSKSLNKAITKALQRLAVE